MKYTFTLILFGLSLLSFSQAPQQINYQGVARDAAGIAIPNATIGLRFEFRQGTATSPVVFSEAQILTTNAMGLFNTQIGKINITGFAALNWENGSLFLELGIDAAGGTNYVSLGTQQLVSVPYAMHAESIPASYAGNVLTVGKHSFTLSSNTSTIDIQDGDNVTVSGTYPNFTVAANPTLNMVAPGTLSISAGNTVDINPPLTYTNNILTVGAPSNTILVAGGTVVATPQTTLTTSGGGATVSSAGTNTFNIHVPSPTLTLNSNTLSISGGNSVTIPAAVTPTITGAGAAVVSPTTGNTFTVTVPNPTLTSSNNTLTLNGANTVTLAPTLAVSGNTLTVGPVGNTVALNSYTVGSGLTMSGGPNFTISSSAASPTINGAGIAVVSPTTGNNFTVTVPVPTLTASNNTLTLNGANTVTIAPTLAVNNNTLTVGPAGNTIALNSYTVGSGLTMSGGPNFTISSSPTTPQTLSLLSPNTLSISNGNSVTIAPTLSVVGSNLSVGPLTNTVNIAPVLTPSGAINISGVFPNYTIYATPAGSVTVQSTTVTGTGLADVTTTATNVYNVDVPVPVLSSIGNTITINQGTVATSATVPVSPTYTSGAGISISSGSIINAAPDQTVSFTNTGQNLITGTYPNFSVATPTLSIGGGSLTITGGNSVLLPASTSVTATGIATVSGGPNYVIGVPAPVLSVGGGSLSISGGNSVPLPSSTTVSAAGIATVSAGPDYTVGVPSPVLTSSGNSITLTQGAAVTTATVASTVNGSVTGGVATLTNSANSFTLNVPNASISATGSTITLQNGTLVTTATVPVSPTYTSGTGISISSNSIINSAPDQTVNFTNTGQTLITGTYPNFNVATPTLSIGSGSITITGGNSVLLPTTPTVSAAGIATVSPGPNYTVGVPAPTLSIGAGNISISGGNSVPLPSTTTVSAAGIATVSAGPDYTVGVPAPSYNPANGILSSGTATTNITPTLNFASNVLTVGPATNTITIPSTANTSLTPAGGASVTGVFPNFTVSAPASPTIAGNGLALVSGTSPNFTVNVPVLTYTASTGGLGSGSNSVNITPPLTISGSTLTSGVSSNSVLLSGISPFTSTGTSIFQTALSNSVGIGTTAPTAKLDVVEGPGYTGVHLKVGNGNASNTNNMVEFSSNGSGHALNVFNNNVSTNAYAGYLDGGMMTRGKTSTSTGYAIRAMNFSGSDIFAVRNDGNVGIGNASPNAPLQFANNIAARKIVLWEGATNNDHQVYGFGININELRYQVDASVASHVFYSGINSTSSKELVRINGTGAMGIGTSVPTATLHVNGTFRLVDGTQGPGRILTTDAAGNASWTANSNWGLTGNSGTAPSTNFIGTIDNVALQFKVNNQPSGLLDPATKGTFFGYQSGLASPTGTSNSGFGYNTLAANSTGSVNTAVGAGALQLNSTGSQNVAVGFEALSNISGSSENVAVGYRALRSSGTGILNTGIGASSLRDNTGSANVAVGASALLTNANGTQNTALGVYAGQNNTAGNLNVFLGYAAGYAETGSNKLYIANSNGANPLIYGDFAAGRLGINTTALGSYNFSIYDVGIFSAMRMSNSTSTAGGFVIGQNSTNVSIINYETTPLFFGTQGANRMVISSTGSVGIGPGAMTPAARLDVSGTVKITDGSEGLNKVLTSDATGNASWQALLPVPSGAIIAYGGTSIPSGWLLCDGTAVSRTGLNANLFAAVGVAWGNGDGSTTFNVPDMRGMFLRGVNGGQSAVNGDPNAGTRIANNAGGNIGNNVGSEQADDLEAHSHDIGASVTNITTLLSANTAVSALGTGNLSAPTGGSETRPKNVYVYYIIKQ